jgi:hypothetical protein
VLLAHSCRPRIVPAIPAEAPSAVVQPGMTSARPLRQTIRSASVA